MSALDSLVVDDYLSLNKYQVDEGNPHIRLAEVVDEAEFDTLILVCPAGLYRRDAQGKPMFDYAGCLECGTCRIVAEGGTITSWTNPGSTMGVEYRHG